MTEPDDETMKHQRSSRKHPSMSMRPMPSKMILSRPSYGLSPSGFSRLHVEMFPREVGRLVGYDPRVLIMRPQVGPQAKGTREIVPHNVSQEIVMLQNHVQRSIDPDRVIQMVEYLIGAMERGQFADWGPIELVTTTLPDLGEFKSKHVISVDADADYFIADGQHRYCALLDFLRERPQYADRFTQAVTISVLPHEKLVQWAGQEFHDRNYFSVPVRPGKALSVDSRDPVNALAKQLAEHSVISAAGGIAYERDVIMTGDTRFVAHSVLHRFVRGFIFGRPGLDKGSDARAEIPPDAKPHLWDYVAALGEALNWEGEDRDLYLSRTSVVLSSLAVIGHDLYYAEPPMTPEELSKKIVLLSKINWRRTNLDLVGVIGSAKNGLVQPASSRQAIDSTIRFIRERLGLGRQPSVV